MAKRASGSGALKAVRAQLDVSARELASQTDAPSAVNTRPLDIALTSDDVLDRLAPKIVKADAQPEVYYIPTSTSATWVVFHFRPMLPPLTFRVSVDIGNEIVKTLEDPYIPDRVA